MAAENFYDVIVIGGGPAGLTAAVYLARVKYRVLVIEKESFGGQITITSEVVNYPGVFKTSGSELTENMRKQAEGFGAEFLLAEAEKIEAEGDIKKVKTSRGDFECFGILAATGARPRTVGFEGESRFKGRGVAYCATCDGEFFAGKEIFVIGGGFAAAEESVFLTKYAKHVTILIREDDFTCAKATADEAKSNENITVLTNTEVKYVDGDDSLKTICCVNLKTGEEWVYSAEPGDTFGVFVFVGYAPETKLFKGTVKLNPQGYIITDENKFTGKAGVYAAGDVCVKNLRQVVTAVGDGALAATELERCAAAMQKKTGIIPVKRKENSTGRAEENSGEAGFFGSELSAQLREVFSKMENSLVLRLYSDKGAISEELEMYMRELAKITDKLKIEKAYDKEDNKPCVKVYRNDGSYTGLAFHGVPGGHEFTSFILGLYNAAGPGQSLDDKTKRAISDISEPVDMKVLVSLSCTMCPELVTAAQKTAALNPLVTAEVFDLQYFPDLQKKYNVMSVPCLVVNDNRVDFGKKNIKQLLDFLKNDKVLPM
ncbi:MAG: FAD-dependent oxidoreductase [Clostridiales bacterium]|nr:FAD-dependent oxidoreductase [Clostridiales bacterium]